MSTASPFSHLFYLMAKPAGPLCNMKCEYCYYLEKERLYRGEKPEGEGSGGLFMSDELLEKFIRDYIGAHTRREVLFTWHGGEALLRPLSFYERIVRLQKKYAGEHVIDNCIQTNGTLLNDDWCRFFRRNHWLVGISIDGPEEFHNEFRRMKGGAPSWKKVMGGIHLLKRHGVEWNAMAVVNDFNADYPLDFYRFFRDMGCRYLQFTPIVERLLPHSDGRQLAAADETQGEVADFSVTPEQWGNFLCKIFDEWVRHDVGTMFVQIFDATLANWVGATPGLCSMARTCGHAGAMEWNGDVYLCDHFVFPAYRLGNILTDNILDMMLSERQTRFGMAKASLPRLCRECRWRNLCNGECPKNRFCTTPDGEPGWNYLCAGYRQYFEHTAPYMEYMKQRLERHEPPAMIMDAIARGELLPPRNHQN